MRPTIATAVLAAGLLLAGCDGSHSTQQVATPADGKALYQRYCAACHQPHGAGVRGAFPPLAGADWLQQAPVEQAIELVLLGYSGKMVVNGVTYNGAMPSFAHLDDAAVAAILGYVYSNWGNDGRAVDPEQVAVVRDRVVPD